MSYKLLTFDVTNTLLRFSNSPGAEYAKIAAQYGVTADADKLTKAFKTQLKMMTQEHPNFGACTGLGYKQWWTNVVEQTFHHSDRTLNKDNLKSISEHLINIYGTNACWKVRPGVLESLKNLKKHYTHLSVGVISNFDERLHRILTEFELRPHFDFVLASYNCGYYKPQKEIFEMALKISNCSSQQAIHIGDDLELDYLAAKSAGWDAVLFCADVKKLSNKIGNKNDRPPVIFDIGETIEVLANGTEKFKRSQ